MTTFWRWHLRPGLLPSAEKASELGNPFEAPRWYAAREEAMRVLGVGPGDVTLKEVEAAESFHAQIQALIPADGEPPVFAPERAVAIAEGRGCDNCLDPDGVPCFPQYGTAPHTCGLRIEGGPLLGGSVELPEAEWPPTFTLDPEAGPLRADKYPRCGTYEACPDCGWSMVKESARRRDTDHAPPNASESPNGSPSTILPPPMPVEAESGVRVRPSADSYELIDRRFPHDAPPARETLYPSARDAVVIFAQDVFGGIGRAVKRRIFDGSKR